MTNIKKECHDNAREMLGGRLSKFIGWIGNCRYYVVDGKAWTVNLMSGVIARSDSQAESDRIAECVQLLNEVTP